MNDAIRRIDVSTASVTTLAGSPGTSGFTDGQGSNAQFWRPADIAFDPSQGSQVAYIVSWKAGNARGGVVWDQSFALPFYSRRSTASTT